jgi:hypothetical protein
MTVMSKPMTETEKRKRKTRTRVKSLRSRSTGYASGSGVCLPDSRRESVSAWTRKDSFSRTTFVDLVSVMELR